MMTTTERRKRRRGRLKLGLGAAATAAVLAGWAYFDAHPGVSETSSDAGLLAGVAAGRSGGMATSGSIDNAAGGSIEERPVQDAAKVRSKKSRGS